MALDTPLLSNLQMKERDLDAKKNYIKKMIIIRQNKKEKKENFWTENLGKKPNLSIGIRAKGIVHT